MFIRETKSVIFEWASAYISCLSEISISKTKSQKSDIPALVESLMKEPKHLYLLRLLFGASCLIDKSRATLWNPDYITELASLLLSTDPFRSQFILYPLLLAIDANKELRQTPLPLKREATILGTACYSI